MHDFTEIATWYKLTKEKDKIVKILAKMRKVSDRFNEESKSQHNTKARQRRKEIIDNTLKKINEIK